MRTRRIGARWPRVAAVAFGLSAIISWMLLLDQGASTARVIAAAATTVASAISIIRLRRGQGDGTEREA